MEEFNMSGKKLFTAINDYTVVDLETCGLYGEERKKVIEISALRFRDDKLTEKFSTLVNPEMHTPNEATLKNNITDEMVENAPVIKDILPDFIDFIGDDVLVGHNIEAFDYKIISKLSMGAVSNSYIDTYRLAQRCLPELPNHKLETLAQHLGLSIDDMHRSEYDCILTQQLYVNLKPLCGKAISPNFYSLKPKTKSNYSYAKVDPNFTDNNPLLGKTCIVYGAFQQLSVDQIKHLFDVIGARYVDFFCYSADILILGSEMYKKYTDGVEDDIITSFIDLHKPIISEYDFVKDCHIIFSAERNASDFITKNDISGKTVCLTGNFDIDSNRDRIIDRIIELGGIVKNNVIKSLDYLIIGNQGSENYKNGSKGNKVEKAEHFNENGAEIKILSEYDFFEETEVLENV